jgi:flagellar biosynthesis protein FlhF
MNIQRFTAPTAREALAKARAVFGEGTLILSNRPTPQGVEVMATAEDALSELDAAANAAAEATPAAPVAAPSKAASKPARASKPATKPTPKPAPSQAAIEADTEQLAMSTLSFQDYVRERMLRRRAEAQQVAQTTQQMTSQKVRQAAVPTPAEDAPQFIEPTLVVPPLASAPEAPRARPATPSRVPLAAPMQAAEDDLPLPDIQYPGAGLAAMTTESQAPARATPAASAPSQPTPGALAAKTPVAETIANAAVAPASAPTIASPIVSPPDVNTHTAAVRPAVVATPSTIASNAAMATPVPLASADVATPALNQQGIVNELQAMKALIDERFNTLAWLGETRQDPIRSNLMLKLIRAGYSPTLSRALLEHLPEGLAAGDALRWITNTLERNLRTDTPGHRLLDEGGVFALVGATGVGKTTTAAKLAGLCVREHGATSVGLITLDTSRVGAHDQLRAYGRQLGVVAHQAHDRAALAELLNLFANRHMVLVDTAGVAPSDPRMRGMLDMLDLPGVNRLLVLNAGSHGDTLDSVLSSFRGTGTQHAILSKLDEAVKLGPALDTLIRHQFTLRGVTNGQRVPEDWGAADASTLVRQSMRAPTRSAFDPRANDLSLIFSPADAAPAEHALANA